MQETTRQERKAPTTWEAWKRQLLMFRTTLLMGIWANPSQLRLQIEEADLNSLYDFLYGPDIMGRNRQPSLWVMIGAERLMWRRIALLLAEDENLTLKDAMTAMPKKRHPDTSLPFGSYLYAVGSSSAREM